MASWAASCSYRTAHAAPPANERQQMLFPPPPLVGLWDLQLHVMADAEWQMQHDKC